MNVDEAMADAEFVFVCSFNEVVDENGSAEKWNRKFPPLGIGGNEYQRSLRVWEVNISDKKEGWGNGRADISFSGVQILPGCSQVVVTGEPFAKVSNNDLNTWFTPQTHGGSLVHLAHITLGNFWDETQQESIPVVFYEKDVRKKFAKSHTLVPACSSSKMYFNSKESIYGVINPAFADYPSGGSAYFKVYNLSGAQIKYRGHTDL